jgi:hypothetical protein
MSSKCARIVSSSPISISSSSGITNCTASLIEIYSSSSASSASSSSSSAPDPFVQLNRYIKTLHQPGFCDTPSPPRTIRVPRRYHIMSDDETSNSGAPLANVPEPQPPVEEMIINPYPGVSYGIPLEECTTSLELDAVPNASEENALPPERQLLAREENFSLEDVAAALDGNVNLSKEEEDLVASSLVNTKKYEDSNKGIEARFFDTIDRYGGQQLKYLLEEITTNFEKEKRFYFMLRGAREIAKQKILNKCLVLCALKWRQFKGEKKGKLYQPVTYEQYMKQLFSVFKKKGINYCHQKDFNGAGEFHGVLVELWKEERENDDTFATGVQTATFDFDADKKIRIAYRDTDFDPFSVAKTDKAFEDRLRYLVFIFGRYFMLRGRKEIAFLEWKQVRFCEAFDSNENVESPIH